MFAPVKKGLIDIGPATSGAVAVEFALVGLPFLLMICGILVLSFMMLASSTLDYATQKAARQIMVGQTQTAGLTASQVRTNVLCPMLPAAMFDCSSVVVQLTTIQAGPEPTAYVQFVKPDFSGLILPPLDNSQTSFCTGSGSSYEVLEVLYPLPLYLSAFSASSRVANGKFILQSTATFKNEPFQSSGTAAAGC